MANVPDLTKAELAAEIKDATVATWWTNAPALPNDVDMVELLAKTLQGGYIAQSKKNSAAVDLQAGEALNSYPEPTTSSVVTDTATGMQTFNATYSLNAVFGVDNNLAVPQRI